MSKVIRIGTRESQLALWQANEVKRLLEASDCRTELVHIKSEGDIDLVTPLYELGVQGVFTKALDAALLNDRIDIAVHSMKDVPTLLANGIAQAAVLPRASYKDLLVLHPRLAKTHPEWLKENNSVTNRKPVIATSSIRRKAQWLHRYPGSQIDNLRGNVNTRLQKLADSNWDGAIFAAAGLERIGLRPENVIELDWMLPAPAQGAIMIVARAADRFCLEVCAGFNDIPTALCVKAERDFLRTLLGGCSTPISALAEISGDSIAFRGSIVSPEGFRQAEVSMSAPLQEADGLGIIAAERILQNGGKEIVEQIRNAT